MGSTVWVPIATFIAGVCVALITQLTLVVSAREDRRLAADEVAAERKASREDRDTERRQKQTDEHNKRQREALTELQEKISDYLRSIGDAELINRAAWRKSGKPSNFPIGRLPNELEDSVNNLQRRVLILQQRIENTDIRGGVGALLDDAVASLSASTVDDAERHGLAMGDRFVRLNELIGAILRQFPND